MKTKSLILAILLLFIQANFGLNSAYSQGKDKGKGQVHVDQNGLIDSPTNQEPTQPDANVVPEPQVVITNPPPVVQPQPEPQPQPQPQQQPKTRLQSRGQGSGQPVNSGTTQLLPQADSSSTQNTNPNPKTTLKSTGKGSGSPVADTVEASGRIVPPLAPQETTPPAAVTPPVAAPNFVPSTNPTKDPCEDKAMAEIYKLLTADHKNVLGIMFELTAMRLAKRTLEQSENYRTFEDLTVDKIKVLNDQVAKLDKDTGIQDKVRKVYEVYGKKDDDKKVEERLKDLQRDARAAADRASNACYFDSEARFRNDESSAFIMATVIGEGGDLSAPTQDKPAKLTDIDAATVWVVERARAEAEKRFPHTRDEGYYIGSKNGNMLNISTRVTRYLGRIADGRQKLTPAMMDELIKKQQADLKKMVDHLYVDPPMQDAKEGAKLSIREELKACIAAEVEKSNVNCKDCAVNDRLKALETVNLDIDNIQRGLLQSVSKGDNLKFENGLQAKLAPVYIDFRNLVNATSTQGGVQTGESTQDIGQNFASNKDAAPGEGPIPKLPPRGTKENCKKFWVKKASRKHGGVAKVKRSAPVENQTPPLTAPDATQPNAEPKIAAQPAAPQTVVNQPKVAPPVTTTNSTPLTVQKKAKPSPMHFADQPEVKPVASTGVQVSTQPVTPNSAAVTGTAAIANHQSNPAPQAQAPAVKDPKNAAPVALVESPSDTGPADAIKAGDKAHAITEKMDQAFAAERLQSVNASKQGANPRSKPAKKSSDRKVAGGAVDPEVQKAVTALNASPGMPMTWGNCKLTFSKEKNTLTIFKNGKSFGDPVFMDGQNTLEREVQDLADPESCAANTNR